MPALSGVRLSFLQVLSRFSFKLYKCEVIGVACLTKSNGSIIINAKKGKGYAI